MVDKYTFGVALFAAIGSKSIVLARICATSTLTDRAPPPAAFLFGFDTGIATTTIAHQSWINYMGHPSKGLTGAVVAVYVSDTPAI